VPSVTLSIILLASVVGALLASVSFLTVQLALERRRQEREGLASQARRLRNKGDQKEVTPPKLEDGWFHVFLSHVWGTVSQRGYTNPRAAARTLL
jgi:hypothetical protein